MTGCIEKSAWNGHGQYTHKSAKLETMIPHGILGILEGWEDSAAD